MTAAATHALRRALESEKARKRPPLTAMINVRFYDELHAWLVEVAARENVSINGLMLSILEDARAGEEQKR